MCPTCSLVSHEQGPEHNEQVRREHKGHVYGCVRSASVPMDVDDCCSVPESVCPHP